MTNADTVKHIIEAIGTTVAAIVTVATWFAGMLPPRKSVTSSTVLLSLTTENGGNTNYLVHGNRLKVLY